MNVNNRHKTHVRELILSFRETGPAPLNRPASLYGEALLAMEAA
jgi:hypothetical protein